MSWGKTQGFRELEKGWWPCAVTGNYLVSSYLALPHVSPFSFSKSGFGLCGLCNLLTFLNSAIPPTGHAFLSLPFSKGDIFGMMICPLLAYDLMLNVFTFLLKTLTSVCCFLLQRICDSLNQIHMRFVCGWPWCTRNLPFSWGVDMSWCDLKKMAAKCTCISSLTAWFLVSQDANYMHFWELSSINRPKPIL